MSEIVPVTVHILGNEYHVSSPANEVEKLEQAAQALDKRMREIKSGGRIMGLERIAVMAALNLSYELLHGQAMSNEEAEAIEQRLKKMADKIDSVLASTAQMELP